MDCFADFCLSCDRQTNGTPFCSQACRLAELDYSSTSEAFSPSYTSPEDMARQKSEPARTGFYLPPAFDFSAHRLSRSSTQPRLTSPVTTSTHSSRHAVEDTSTLSPSSSHTSISSIKTTQSYYSRLSQQAERDLKDYARSFDQVRTLKRRISLL